MALPAPARATARLAVVLASLTMATVACADDGPTGDGPGATSTGVTTDGTAADCFWSEAVTASSNNLQYPDSGATYWYSAYTVPAGASLRLSGTFPHARYLSFNVYGPDPTTGDPGHPLDALADVDIAADPGSANPFVEGADRTVEDRAYGIEIVPAPAPGDRAANTLYGDTAEQQIIYRVYVADQGRDPTGDAGLPTVTLALPDGTVLEGDDACATLGVDTVLHTERLPTLSREAYDELVALGDAATHPAFDPPVWRAFFNPTHALLSTFWTGTGNEADIATLDATRRGGYFSNVDNQYLIAPVSRLLGPAPDGANLLVLTGAAPVTPATSRGEPRMEPGQVRYWSLCQNESPVTTRGSGCLYDEQVPRRSDGTYTIVVGRPEDRPANATAECGVAWLDWGPGDGAGRPTQGTLLLRHMLPAPDFEATIANVTAPGQEAEVLGPYLPVGAYLTPDAFAARGCPV